MNKLEIIDRIGYIRVKAKLTQKALSLAIEMNVSYINRLESKRDFLPSLEVLLRIIEACGSSTEEFFYNDIIAYEKDKQLIEKLKTIPTDKIDLLLKYDDEFMHLFSRLNEKFVKLKPEDLALAKSHAEVRKK